MRANTLLLEAYSAVRVQGEEERESTEVHISLGVEFTGLHVGAVSFAKRRAFWLCFFGDAPDAITRINEQEEDKDKCDFETVLYFSDLSSMLCHTRGYIPQGT